MQHACTCLYYMINKFHIMQKCHGSCGTGKAVQVIHIQATVCILNSFVVPCRSRSTAPMGCVVQFQGWFRCSILNTIQTWIIVFRDQKALQEVVGQLDMLVLQWVWILTDRCFPWVTAVVFVFDDRNWNGILEVEDPVVTHQLCSEIFAWFFFDVLISGVIGSF